MPVRDRLCGSLTRVCPWDEASMLILISQLPASCCKPPPPPSFPLLLSLQALWACSSHAWFTVPLLAFRQRTAAAPVTDDGPETGASFSNRSKNCSLGSAPFFLYSTACSVDHRNANSPIYRDSLRPIYILLFGLGLLYQMSQRSANKFFFFCIFSFLLYSFKIFQGNWHTALYSFQVYSKLIQHLYILWNDHRNKSS